MLHFHLFLVFLFRSCLTSAPISVDMENDLSQGMYIVKAKVGSNGKIMRLHYDTGSSLTVIPSSSCETCRDHGHSLFSIEDSSSYEKISCSSSLCGAFTCNSKCKYSKMCSSLKCCDGTDPSYCGYYVQYADKSETEGGLSRDVIALVGSSQDTQAIKTTFGLAFKESGTWVSFADGLMGSSYGSGNGNPSISPSWFDSYVESDSSVSDIFITCFGREKGVLSVGGLDSSLKEGSIYYADIQDSFFFSLRLNDFRLNNKTMLTQAYHAIIDSGTTYTYIPADIFSKLRQLFLTHYPDLPLADGKVLDGTYALGVDPSNTWPSIDFYFDGFFLSVPPSVYFFKYKAKDSKPAWFFGIAPSTSSFFLLGDTFMSAFTIVHDREQSVVGFAVPSKKCSYTGRGSINETNYKPPTDTTAILIVIALICILVILCCITLCVCVFAIRKRKDLPVQL